MAKSKVLPVKSSKSFQLHGSQHEAVMLEEKLTQQFELLTCNAGVYRKSASTGKWLSSRRLVLVQTPKGGTWTTHGHVREGELLVSPLEALYLLEHGNLIITNEDHVMSIEEAYTVMLDGSNGLCLEHYQVYAHLKRTGFIVYVNSQSETGLMLRVYKHSKNFKKTQPGTPHGYVVVVRPLDPFPDRSQLVAMETSSILLLYAVVDGSGNITYYKIQKGNIHPTSFY